MTHAPDRDDATLLRHLIDGLGPGMFVGLATPDGVMLEANAPALAAFGLRGDEVIGRRLDEVRSFTYATPVRDQLRDAIARAAAGETVRYDVDLLAAEGMVTVDFSLRPLVRDGRVIYLVPSAVDVTDRRASERARRDTEARLRENEARLRLALDAARIGMFDWDITNDRITWSRWHERLWGMAEGEFGGTYPEFATRVFPDDLPALEANLRACMAAGRPFTHVFRVRWPDGTVRWVAGRGTFSFGDAGQPVRMRGAVTDVTDQKVAELALRDSESRLRRALERVTTAREDESARIALELHDELGQALTHLKLDLAWIDRRLAERDDAALAPLRERAGAMQEDVDATIRTVRRLSTELRPAVLDDLGLEATLEWHIEEFQKRTGVRATVQLDLDLAAIEPRRATAVYRILSEALTNVARHAHATQVTVHAGRDDGWLTMRVEDDGRGIPPDAAARDGALGIVGMEERAHALGGELKLTRAASGGTVVWLRLPEV